MAAYNGERNSRFGDTFNVIKITASQHPAAFIDAEQNIFDDVFIYDILNTPLPPVTEGQLNSAFSSVFNGDSRFDSANTYVEYLITTYQGQFNTHFHNALLNLPRFDNFIPAPIDDDDAEHNILFHTAFMNLIQINGGLTRLPYLKKRGQFFPKVTGGYRYGGNTDY
jgi:hypothetical protein